MLPLLCLDAQYVRSMRSCASLTQCTQTGHTMQRRLVCLLSRSLRRSQYASIPRPAPEPPEASSRHCRLPSGEGAPKGRMRVRATHACARHTMSAAPHNRPRRSARTFTRHSALRASAAMPPHCAPKLLSCRLRSQPRSQQKPTTEGCAKFPGYFLRTGVIRTYSTQAASIILLISPDPQLDVCCSPANSFV
ncbi:hypothetical protein XocBAI20_15435 [Xanthomonas oryzae pv. oryzicola]|nr:hypothetical protein XocBAI20_15435 [Xanthomonas oryzae pv. oryzicola]